MSTYRICVTFKAKVVSQLHHKPYISPMQSQEGCKMAISLEVEAFVLY